MTTTETLELMKVMDAHNAQALISLKEMDEEIARKRNALNPMFRCAKRRPDRADMETIAARLAHPLTPAQRAKRDRDMRILTAAYRLDAEAYEPTPLQRRWDIAMALIHIWRQAKKNPQPA